MGLAPAEEVCVMVHVVRLRKMERRRSLSARLRAGVLSVAMKMVSSPEMVPTTSGQSALSMATATLLRGADGGADHGEGRAGRLDVAHERARAAKLPLRARGFIAPAARSGRWPSARRGRACRG